MTEEKFEQQPYFFETQAIRAQMERTQYREHAAPLFMTSSFVFDSAEEMAAVFSDEADGFIYSRYANPNTDELIRKVCLMENTEAGHATASGMAAVFNSIVPFVQQGDHILASRAVFGSTHQILTQLLPRWGITHTYVEPQDVDNWGNFVQPNTKMIVLESPSNPSLAVIDLQKVGIFAKQYGLLFNIDNCFATPFIQRPTDFGADIVVHSATKFMDGQGRALGGLILGSKQLMEKVAFFLRHTGPSMSPFHAWLFSKSLETLAVRMERHCANALSVADHLAEHPAVAKVVYPFLESHPDFAVAKRQMRYGGGLVTFEVKGGLEAGRRFLNQVQMLSRSSNLGDTRTIATHPASTTHSKLTESQRQSVGITDGLIRLSVGLENIVDILNDIDKGLQGS